MTAPTEDLIGGLRALQAASPGVSAVTLSTVEGRILGSTATDGSDRLRISAVSAASLAIGRKGTRDLRLGDVRRIHIRGEQGSILIVGVGQAALLALVIEGEVELERLLREVNKASERLEALLAAR